MNEALKQRIERERAALKLKPWELSPSEVDDGPCPWPPGTAGYQAWGRAKQLRDELRKAKERTDGKP